MKFMMILSALAFSVSVFAGTVTPLPEDATSTSPLAGSVSSVEPLCPADVTCITNGSSIAIEFVLNGCLDDLIPPTYAVSGDTVYVSGTNVHTSGSEAAFCIDAPRKFFTIAAPGLSRPFKVVYLGTTKTEEIK